MFRSRGVYTEQEDYEFRCRAQSGLQVKKMAIMSEDPDHPNLRMM